MSLRQQVDQQRIEYFLQQLGKRFTKSGRVYLVGGTSIVYEGLRQQTLDIDLTFEVAPEDHSSFIEVVRDLKERLSLNIEEVSPADFIPLPSGYKERSQYINRYGQLDIFHFDLYSVALSKSSTLLPRCGIVAKNKDRSIVGFHDNAWAGLSHSTRRRSKGRAYIRFSTRQRERVWSGQRSGLRLPL